LAASSPEASAAAQQYTEPVFATHLQFVGVGNERAIVNLFGEQFHLLELGAAGQHGADLAGLHRPGERGAGAIVFREQGHHAATNLRSISNSRVQVATAVMPRP
jgi:hypothetical protein